MQEANIRLIELRHTLPNLKSLLLTLSSPVPPGSFPSTSRSSTYVDSRASSRQASRAWSIPHQQGSPSSSSAGRETLNGLDTPSPLRKVVGRSTLSRPNVGREMEMDGERDPEKGDGEGSELSRSVVSAS